MERLKELLRQREFHLLLFCFSTVMVSWPLVSFSDLERLKVMFAYLCIVWGVIIALLFAVSCTLDDPHRKHPSEKANG